MTIYLAVLLYILAMALIPAVVSAYSLAYAAMQRDSDRDLREAYRVMAFCIRMIGPYFALCTLALLLTIWWELAGKTV